MSTVYAVRPDSSVVYFTQNNGQWVTDSDVKARLERTATGWTYHSAFKDEKEDYDATGKLQRITSRAGLSQTLTYDVSGRLSYVTDSHGRNLALTYNADGRLASVTDPNGQVSSYSYDTQGRLLAVTHPDGKLRSYTYGDRYNANVMTSITDENGVVTKSWTYDSAGRAINAQRNGGADATHLYYDYNIVTVTDARANVHTYNFQAINGVNKLTGMTQPPGSGCPSAASALTYDNNSNVKTRKDFNGNTTWYDYDMTRNLEITRIEAQGTPQARTITTQWHPVYRLPTVITEPGRVTTNAYDDSTGNVLSRGITDTATNTTRTTTYAYTTIADGTLPGLLKSIDGPRTDVNDVTTYAYYPNGDLLSITNAIGHITTFEVYDGNGKPTRIRDANGQVTTMTYTPRGWLSSMSVGGLVTLYDYDGVGQLIRITRPDLSYFVYVYDGAHRLTDVYDSVGNSMHYTLDAMGNRVREQVLDVNGSVITTKQREFDALNRLWHEIGALNQTTTYAYDANGNLLQVDGPRSDVNDVTVYTYDTLNRMSTATDGLAGVTRYGYDGLDQLTQVTDPRNLSTQYTKDAFGNSKQVVSPDTGTTNNVYDAANNLVSSTDANGVITTYTYDALNRVTSRDYSTGGHVDYLYDSGPNAIGRLSQIDDGSGSTSLTYDGYGHITQRTQTIANITKPLVVQYGYDGAGRLASVTYPSGKVLTYTYRNDQIDLLKWDGATLVSLLSYQPFGPVNGWRWGNGSMYQRQFDADGRLYSYPFAGDTRSLGFDSASNIVSVTDASGSQSIGYDALNRLTNWNAPIGTQAYAYDATGNRTQLTDGAAVYPYGVDALSNRLLNIAGPQPKTYQYNLFGNLVSDGTTTFSYDGGHRLIGVTTPNGSFNYGLNALSQRVIKSNPLIPSGATAYMYDEQGHLLGEYDVNGNALQETIYLGDLPIAVVH